MMNNKTFYNQRFYTWGFFGIRDEIIALFVKAISLNIIKDLVTYSIFHFS